MAAIDVDPEMLRSAIVESEEWMQTKLTPFKHLVDRMAGRWYRNMTPVDSSGDGAAGMDLGLANHEFELLSLMLGDAPQPQIVDAPLVRIEDAVFATTMDHFLHSPNAPLDGVRDRILAA